MSEKTENVGETAQKLPEKFVALIGHTPFIKIHELSQETKVATRTIEHKLRMDGRLNRVGPDNGYWESMAKDREEIRNDD